MKRVMLAGMVAALATAGLASAVEAQVPGIPVYNAGIPRGVGIYGDVGFNNDAAGGGTAYAVTGRGGFGPFGATAILSSYDPDGSADFGVSVGATANYRVFGGPLVPLTVTLQGGLGYASFEVGGVSDNDATRLHVPIGVGFALTIPNPILAIKPWLAPRVDIVRFSGDNFQSRTDTEFGLSGGLEFNLLSGIGLHASYDATFVEGGTRGVFGLGAHYTFRAPGL